MAEPLEIQCPKCDATYRVGAELAGHRVQCASCSERFDAPALGGAGEPAERVWRFRMPGGQRFGPLSKAELDEYLFEGILTGECQIHREGEGSWWWAAEIYPHVPDHQSSASRHSDEAASAALCGGLPAGGLLDRIPSIRDRLPMEHARAHDLLDSRIEKEAEESEHELRPLGSRTIGLVQSVGFGRQFSENFAAAMPGRTNVRVNSLAISGFGLGGQEFYLVAPYSHLEPLPHEFFAILPGELPTAMVLRAGTGATPLWLGEDKSATGVVATAMKHNESMLGVGANWKWVSKDRKIKLQLKWAIQLVPLGCEQFAVIAQTAGVGRKGRLLGLEWFVEQLHHARRLRAQLNIPGGCEARFPYHSESAELIARMFGDT